MGYERAAKGNAQRGVGVGRSLEKPVCGEDLAGFPKLVRRSAALNLSPPLSIGTGNPLV